MKQLGLIEGCNMLHIHFNISIGLCAEMKLKFDHSASSSSLDGPSKFHWHHKGTCKIC